MAPTLSDLLDGIDTLIQQGKAGDARRAVLALVGVKKPREQTARFAGLCRRVGLPRRAIRLLNPLVRPALNADSEPTEMELAEYAAALTRIGAVEESLSILRTLNARRVPQAGLFEAFALVSHWNYTDALEVLRPYCKDRSLGPYQKLVGEVNLASALLHTEAFKEAKSLLERLREGTREEGFSLLHGNVLELIVQNEILQGDWVLARQSLGDTECYLRDTGTLDEFFVRKWRAILEVRCQNATRPALRSLAAIREEAVYRGHWETVRDCDYFRAMTTENFSLALHLYFGTPYPHFRERVLSHCQLPDPLPETYDWACGLEGKRKSKQAVGLDLVCGVAGEGSSLTREDTLHRLFSLLATDFYRSFGVPVLREGLFPAQYYRPQSSAMEVRQVIKASRGFLLGKKTGVQIVYGKGLYRLTGTAKARVRVGAPQERRGNTK